MAPLRALGKPIADVVGAEAVRRLAEAFDPLLTPGRAQLLEVARLRRAAPTALIDGDARRRSARLPTPQCEIFIGHLGGAINASRPTRPPIRTATSSS